MIRVYIDGDEVDPSQWRLVSPGAIEFSPPPPRGARLTIEDTNDLKFGEMVTSDDAPEEAIYVCRSDRAQYHHVFFPGSTTRGTIPDHLIRRVILSTNTATEAP